MSMKIYVADIDDPEWSWDASGERWSGNLPTRWLSSSFPPDDAPAFEIISGLREGRYKGDQIDWGAWAVKMTKDEILRFIREHYEPHASGWPGWSNGPGRLRTVIDEIAALDATKIYGLVVYEEA